MLNGMIMQTLYGKILLNLRNLRKIKDIYRLYKVIILT